MMGTTTVLIIVVVVIAVNRFKKFEPSGTQNTGIAKLLEHKWYIDELYDTLIVNPLNALAGFFKNVVEKSGIDGVVNGVGRLVSYGSRQLRLLQSGQVGNYLLVMVLAMVVFFLIWFNDVSIMNFLTKLF